jgi:adenylate kinase
MQKANMKFRTMLLVGAPGAGKGTQGKILGTIPNFFHCACGDVFRNLTIESELGRIFLRYSGKGKLVPDTYTVRLWRDNITAQTQLGRFDPERDTLVLDGIPRNLHQAKMLQDALDIAAVYNFICPDENQLAERLQRRALRDNRLDDANLEVIKKRLAIFEKETKPILEYYGPELVHTIDSTQSPINVLRDILRVLAKI